MEMKIGKVSTITGSVELAAGTFNPGYCESQVSYYYDILNIS